MQYAFNKATLEAGKITLQRKDTICATQRLPACESIA
jgi:hypothetical protein